VAATKVTTAGTDAAGEVGRRAGTRKAADAQTTVAAVAAVAAVTAVAAAGRKGEDCCPVCRSGAVRKSRGRQPSERRAADAAATPTQGRRGASIECHGDIGGRSAGRGALFAGKGEAGREEMAEMLGG